MHDPNSKESHSKSPSLSQAAMIRRARAKTAPARVVSGGAINLPDSRKPFLERMVTGSSKTNERLRESDPGYAQAVLASVAVNIEAGVRYLETQEGALAKIGGNLSEVAALVTASRSPHAGEESKGDMQVRFEEARGEIRDTAVATHGRAALFSVGEAPPVVVTVPASGEWEGLALDRANLGTPGMVSIETGKIHGPSPGLYLDEGSIRRALDDWKKLCITNRLQWGMLVERLHRIDRRQKSIAMGESWTVPPSPEELGHDGIRRPHQSN